MNKEAMGWAWSQWLGRKPLHKFVLVMLAMDANADGVTRTTLEKLQQDTEIKPIERLPELIKELEEMEMLVAEIVGDQVVATFNFAKKGEIR